MAEHQLAHRYERKAQGSLCRHPCAHRRRTTTANQGQGPATSARGGSLAHRRTQGVGREEILSRQPAGKDRPAHLGGYHQGAMDLRTGSPTAEGRTRSRSLRGTILARPSPPCAHDDDRVRLPPASPPCNCKAGKKESTGHRPSRPCQPCATPSSNSSLDHRRSDARIAENGFATSSGGSKSAKVVLDFLPFDRRRNTSGVLALCASVTPDCYYHRRQFGAHIELSAQAEQPGPVILRRHWRAREQGRHASQRCLQPTP